MFLKIKTFEKLSKNTFFLSSPPHRLNGSVSQRWLEKFFEISFHILALSDGTYNPSSRVENTWLYMSFWLIYKGYKFIVISVRFIWNLQEINLCTCCCKFSSFKYKWRRCMIFLCDLLILSYDTLMRTMVASNKSKNLLVVKIF